MTEIPQFFSTRRSAPRDRIELSAAILDKTSAHFDGVDIRQLTATPKHFEPFTFSRHTTAEPTGNIQKVDQTASGDFTVAEYAERTDPQGEIVEERATLYEVIDGKKTSISVIMDANPTTVDVRFNGRDLNTVAPAERRRAAEVFDLPLHLGVRTNTLPPTSSSRIIWKG